ncbi:MAG: CDP-diacylglycerol--glycerol-3-phosphate 3-phosphatidyltransferase [Candidatus Cloacimonadales bacterium]|jgi:CDP-diacylglycerol--glycerol-3-phosphate 3-phosphatidyltransferase|nr:CDP-diacylglycerol--glycerol-3-phosphate 3-phosphatidyltransferase [Candidatus Cloacimonadota bacterium]MDD2650081.1 CDP-diacylglycerol--glycerol-3-phosphate 3-phosphatidyltransferase [Candidatus Cloacimonadota bacterium]MDD3501085.1 CDP-diacylglycerol--glycerol-3-phosphate 3-phosphatidyltransferase [Candidatus Cloacimonadota bacterium]MDX9976746.1 CDP-diacylglycerol--glycerol-3-phosphate 3-phosphatidyltransferase [Candidatus Cloacimonadales bacterium]
MIQHIPNALTLLRVIAVPVFIITMDKYPFTALLIFIGASITDFLDGYLARKLNVISNFGKIMDPLADKILIISAMILLSLPPIRYIHWIIVAIVTVRELAVTVLRDYYRSKNIIIAANIWGKIKTVLQMVGIISALLYYSYGFVIDYKFEASVNNAILLSIKIFFWIVAVITVLSGTNYFIIKKRK